MSFGRFTIIKPPAVTRVVVVCAFLLVPSNGTNKTLAAFRVLIARPCTSRSCSKSLKLRVCAGKRSWLSGLRVLLMQPDKHRLAASKDAATLLLKTDRTLFDFKAEYLVSHCSERRSVSNT